MYVITFYFISTPKFDEGEAAGGGEPPGLRD